MAVTRNLIGDENAEQLIHRAVNLDQIIVFEVEGIKQSLSGEPDLASALDYVVEKALENARTLHELRRAMRRERRRTP